MPEILDKSKIKQLDSEGCFVVDFIVGESGDIPENWTADLVGNGYYKAQYQDGIRNADTGEWTGGHWVETGGPSHEDLIAEAAIKKNALMTDAALAIAHLQDAVDIDEATTEELALWKLWKSYRVALNRIDANLAPDIVWPASPVE